MFGKKLVLYVDKGEAVDGEVVNEGNEGNGTASKVWAWFFHHGTSTSDGKPLQDNGRQYNSSSGNWEYTTEANGNANPYQCNYEAPQDSQGSVPVWDGYNGE